MDSVISARTVYTSNLATYQKKRLHTTILHRRKTDSAIRYSREDMLERGSQEGTFIVVKALASSSR